MRVFSRWLVSIFAFFISLDMLIRNSSNFVKTTESLLRSAFHSSASCSLVIELKRGKSENQYLDYQSQNIKRNFCSLLGDMRGLLYRIREGALGKWRGWVNSMRAEGWCPTAPIAALGNGPNFSKISIKAIMVLEWIGNPLSA